MPRKAQIEMTIRLGDCLLFSERTADGKGQLSEAWRVDGIEADGNDVFVHATNLTAGSECCILSIWNVAPDDPEESEESETAEESE